MLLNNSKNFFPKKDRESQPTNVINIKAINDCQLNDNFILKELISKKQL